MASRNVKPSSVHGYDSPNISDKMQSSTLKRQPNPDWSKADLLRLLSYFEGELQARDIAIAALKAEKAKQLLYQAKYGRFGLGDPFIALQRDAEGKNDGGFDEAAIKSMYDNQLAQLENLIATQRKAQLKMREQLGSSEKRFHKLCTELEEEKQKHAQDTAQGDDVTYMLEKERERLKAEIDFEKSQNKKLEKDLKKSLASLEEEKANSARHKQVAIMLIKERKHLIERIVAESQIRDEMETALTDGKSKIQDMAEGLAQESKKALKMEAAMEKQNTKFDAEREALRVRLQEEEKQTKILKAEVTRLSKQLESLQVQIRNNGSSSNSGQLRSSVSPARAANSPHPGRGGVIGVGLTAPGSTLQSSLVDSTSYSSSLELPSDTPEAGVYGGVPTGSSGHPLEFLGPEMANLQQVLATMTTDETQSGTSLAAAPALAISEPHPSAFSPVLAKPLTQAPLSLPEFTSLLDRSPKTSNGVNLDQNTNRNYFNFPSSPNTGQNTNRNYFNFPSSPKTTKEQHLNATDCLIQGPDFKKTVKVTAQVWPLIVEPVSQDKPYIGTSVSTPMDSCIPRIICPSSATYNNDPLVNSISVHPISSSNFIPTHISNLTIQSAAAKRRSIPPRSRSKSPLKAPNNHTRSFSASGRIPSSASLTGSNLHPGTHWFLASSETSVIQHSPTAEVSGSPVHEASAQGKVETLLDHLARHGDDVNKELPGGTMPLHCAAENNQAECVRLLLEKGAKPSSQRKDKVTPLHLACLKGFTSCANHLLNKGAEVNATTSINQTPLHLSVNAKQIECCQLLLLHGANILLTGSDGLTPLHYAVQGGHFEIIKILLDKLRQTGASRDSETASRLVSMTDKDGWSITHMSAHLPSQECLVLLNQYLPLDFESRDKLGRSVRTVASAACKAYIGSVVTVELRNIQESTTVSSVLIGYLEVRPSLSWKVLEDLLRGCLTSYLAQLDVGLKTRRIARLDADFDLLETDVSLGLTMDSIRNFEIGHYKWTPGVQTSTSPYGIISDLEHKKVAIIVDDSENVCELIAFDVLHPVSSITNYLRLLDQYKSLIFYGPSGSGKSYLAHRLAQSIAAQELSNGRKPAIYQLDLQPGLTHTDFWTYLKQRHCVLPVSQSTDLAPILLLDNLESVDIAELFGGLLDAVEHRGKGHAFNLPGIGEGTSHLHYLANQFYLIGTMNKSRSLGVDLSILPRFRWIQFRLDTEPLRGLLARHYFRRLLNAYQGCMPAPDEPVFRAIEWVVCAWHRLNESLHKLGIPEVIQGPCLFFKCPLEKLDHRLILQWMKNMWNNQIGPGVREAVKRGTGSESPSDGQQKVANTALYVLMQRSVILSCPLSGQEKEAYFAGFMGSNELDIPLRSSDGRARGALWPANSPKNSQHQRRPHVFETLLVHRQKNERDTSPNASPSSAINQRGSGGRNRNGLETPTDSTLVAQNIKRRSLSDSSVNSSLLEQQRQQEILNGAHFSTSSQAKVAKLEIKSTKVVNITSAFVSPSLSPSQTSDASSTGGVPLRKTGRVSPLLTLVANKQQASPKKSRSSENISGGSLYGQPAKLRSCGLFSFSLTTPSNLSSFKFLDSAKVESGMNLADQMPDFSVFDKVPTPTEELPPKGFGFMEKLSETGNVLHNTSRGGEHQFWGQHPDVFKPIYTPGVEDVNGLPRPT